LVGLVIAGDVAEVERWFWTTHAAYGRATAASGCSGIDGRGRKARLRWALRNVDVVVRKGWELENKCEGEEVVCGEERTGSAIVVVVGGDNLLPSQHARPLQKL